MNHTTFIVLSLFVSLCLATNGLDISNDICNSLNQGDWNCLAQQHNFTIIEGIRGGYGITSNIATCVSQAWAAGFQHVDLYVWMCPNCDGNNPPDNLISQLVNQVGVKNFGMIWLDLEVCDSDPSCWSDSQSNLNYIVAMLKAAQNAGANVGIYSTPYEWNQLFGGLAPTTFSNLSLWYANPDGTESFSDFSPFGGWNQPSIKQYSWTGAYCGVSYDADWYP